MIHDLRKSTDPPSDQRKRRSLLEYEIRTADDPKIQIAVWQAPNRMNLIDHEAFLQQRPSRLKGYSEWK